MPLELIINPITEALSKLSAPPPPPPPKRPEYTKRELKLISEEEKLILKMEACTLYDDWMAYKAKLKALRASMAAV